MTVLGISPDEKDLRKFALVIQQLSQGRSNATGTVTLTVDEATTTVADVNCSVDSVPILVPTTANAVAELGNGTIYISAVANGSFTITHANSATTGRTFKYALQG